MPTDADQLDITAFLASLQGSRAASPKTVSSYRDCLQRAAQFSAGKLKIPLRQWRSASVGSFVMHCAQQKLAAATIALHLCALRALFHFMLKQQWIRDNPAQGMRGPKRAQRLPRALDIDQSLALCEAGTAQGDARLLARDKAIVELFYSSGLRLAELCALDLSDWMQSENGLRVTGKGNKTRIVPVGTQARLAMEQWLQQRSAMAGASENALFLSQRGSRLSARQIQQRLASLGQQQGISSRVHPHKLRHSCATHFLEGAQDLRAVQDLLGHANLNTTQIYTHLDFSHLAKIYDAAHPRAKKSNT